MCVTEEQLRELPNFERSEVFSPLEKLALGYAAAVTRMPTEVTDDSFGALRERLSEAQLVELTAAIALDNYALASTTPSAWDLKGSRRAPTAS